MKKLGNDLHDRVVMAGLVGCAAFLPLVGSLAHRGVGPMVLLMGLIAATRAEPWRKGVARFLLSPDWRDPLTQTVLALLMLTLWLALAGLWAPRADGPRLALNFGAPLLAGGVVAWEIARRPERQTRLLARVLGYGAAAAMAILFFEALTGGLLSYLLPPEDPTPGRTDDWKELGRGATVGAALLFATMLLLRRLGAPRLALAALFIAMFAAAAVFGITANAIAIALGGAVFMVARRRPASATFALAAAALVLLAAFPFSVFIPAERIVEGGTPLPLSWEQRLFIWREGARVALDCLPFGCGPDYARAIKDTFESVLIPGAPGPLSRMPVHPHSVFLQLWMEGGVPGVLLFAAAIVASARALASSGLDRSEKAAVAATAMATIVSMAVEASLWQVWRPAAPMLAGMLIALAAVRRDARLATGERSE